MLYGGAMAKRKRRLHENGPVLTAAREERGFSVLQFANEIGCGPATVRSVEYGWRFYKPALAVRAARVLGLPIKATGGEEAVTVDREFVALQRQRKGGKRG